MLSHVILNSIGKGVLTSDFDIHFQSDRVLKTTLHPDIHFPILKFQWPNKDGPSVSWERISEERVDGSLQESQNRQWSLRGKGNEEGFSSDFGAFFVVNVFGEEGIIWNVSDSGIGESFKGSLEEFHFKDSVPSLIDNDGVPDVEGMLDEDEYERLEDLFTGILEEETETEYEPTRTGNESVATWTHTPQNGDKPQAKDDQVYDWFEGA